ncbi:MAG: AMP-dependent synthetase/ligase [Bacteroidales bacterium]
MENSIVAMIRNRLETYAHRDVLHYKNPDGSYHSMTGGEFWNEIIKVSRALKALGIKPSEKIGILSDNMPQWTITDLAILAMQGIVIPVFGGSSYEQIEHIINETNMRYLFVGNQSQLDNAKLALKGTQSLEKIITFKDDTEVADTRCISWEGFLNLGSEFSVDLCKEAVNAIPSSQIATIIFTSGTTGNPKGVMLSHGNFMQCFAIHDVRLNINNSDLSMCFLPLSHVFERAWTYYILHRGGRNFYVENPRTIIDELKVVKPTVMCAVPRFFEKTYSAIQLEVQKWSPLKKRIFSWSISVGERVVFYRAKNARLPLMLKTKLRIADTLVLSKLRGLFGGNIKAIPCSGAAMVYDHLLFFHAIGLFVNYGYGSTETTATVSCFRNDVFDLKSCGTIMPEVQVKLSDTGEIMVKGKTVFAGYYNNLDDTNSAIEDGWYKTGDRGLLTNSGDLVMTDRINDIFKTSGGKFISPQKIELMLLKDAFIEQAVIIGNNRKFVTALIVPSFEKIKAVWIADSIKSTNDQELINNPRVFEFLQNRIDQCLKTLPNYEKVLKFKLIAVPFSVSDNTLTNTLKVRRKLIEERHESIISEMYL